MTAFAMSVSSNQHEKLADHVWCFASQVERGASDKDVKRAYRQLSLQYHPDKNPDPAAAKYFTESISKAYKALTGQSKMLARSYHAADLLTSPEAHPVCPLASKVQVAVTGGSQLCEHAFVGHLLRERSRSI